MSDIGLYLIDDCIQLKLEDGDLAADEGLETAILISLFSDRRVRVDELPDGIETRKGWWGDMYPPIQGDKIGSKLWILARQKTTLQTVAAMETLAQESLQWLIDDGVASLVSVQATLNDDRSITLAIQITRQTGEDARFDIVWDKQDVRRA